MLPSFDEFLAEMGEDYFRRLSKTIEDDMSGSYSLNDISILVGNTVGLSISISLQVLRDYHEWLSRQLSQQSPGK